METFFFPKSSKDHFLDKSHSFHFLLELLAEKLLSTQIIWNNITI